jgi:hypothetical protein
VSLFLKRIKSTDTFEVTGRGTIKVCDLSNGPFRRQQKLFIDGVKYIINSIEMTSPPGKTCGLVVREIK